MAAELTVACIHSYILIYHGVYKQSCLSCSRECIHTSVSLVPRLSPSLAGRAWEQGYTSVELDKFLCMVWGVASTFQ